MKNQIESKDIDKEIVLKKCHYCGSMDKYKMFSGLEINTERKVYRVGCGNCFCLGLSGEDEEEAINTWNAYERR